jgi:hypothetical protein
VLAIVIGCSHPFLPAERRPKGWAVGRYSMEDDTSLMSVQNEDSWEPSELKKAALEAVSLALA